MDNFRLDRGEAMFFSVNTYKALYKNRHHFSRESVVVLYSSDIVPQGSPLLVGYEMK